MWLNLGLAHVLRAELQGLCMLEAEAKQKVSHEAARAKQRSNKGMTHGSLTSAAEEHHQLPALASRILIY